MYLSKEAEEFRLEKQKKVKKYIELVKKIESNNVMSAYKKMIELTNECFGDLDPEEKEKHIMYHAFLGSELGSEKGEFIFDKKDEEAEKILNKKINKIKDN
jgi:hypothetical protein